MTGHRIPTDSAEAREFREAELEAEHEPVMPPRPHEARCRNGWLGEDSGGRPVPCLVCRPHLVERRQR